MHDTRAEGWIKGELIWLLNKMGIDCVVESGVKGWKVDFIVVQDPGDKRLVNALQLVVDESEAEAIVLALERNSRLMVDDLRGERRLKRWEYLCWVCLVCLSLQRSTKL